IYGGQQWRPFIHVDDVALALIRGLEAPLEVVSGEIFNVGSEKGNLRLIELGELIQRVVPGIEVSVRESAEDPRNYRVSFAKMEHVVGFVASKSVEDAVREIVHALQSGQIADYRRPQYSNVQWLTENGETAITMVPNIYSVVMRTAEQISAAS
ncbi:MAG: NAD-dependent epimerase/dehydratase family protein, partial [Anaerolineae bacterium]|nr:NAD-dependent epimerase/dehydratase family protein [Anaerolineae bacterium]